jgi:ATP-dependent helicase/nuclease subunit A
VALTRAQSWLIVAAAGDPGKEEAEGEASPPPWYRLVEAGMTAAGAWAAEDGGLVFTEGQWPAPAGHARAGVEAAEALPAWANHAAKPAPRPPQPVSPSALGGAKALPGEPSDQAAMEKGTVLHRLLEVLPTIPGPDRIAVAEAIVAGTPFGAGLMAEAMTVLDDATLASLFGPDALVEVALTARLEGRVLAGAVDRLLVAPDRVLAVDYKSNRAIPGTPEEVPEGLLRQLGAYAEALAQIYPERQIEVAILWTKGPLLMQLPPDIVRAALARATIP